MTDTKSTRPRGLVLVGVGVVVLLLVVATGGLLVARAKHVGPWERDPQDLNRYATQGGYADPDSGAAQAARQATADGDARSADVFGRLAAVPSGIWLTPEQYPAGQVGPYVSSVLAAADEQDAVATLVVYGVPDRDCSGGYSAGGLAEDEYAPWVQEIASAASGHDSAVVVLEPDALAATVACGDEKGRVALIGDAVARMSDAGVTTYVDGGHSNWVTPGDMARLLREVGVGKIRGFATNVANFQTDLDEQSYAERVSELSGGGHFVIDTGRNGKGSTDDWCNPPGRAFGTMPGYVDDGSRLDAFVWVKPPGESDGECGGGPTAGEFWPQRALEMASESGW
ncbi:glycoside hydrolase family 6 protein [Nocardioides sp. MAHUQ-72]|uniref:glycoside hydrolase family 6 protein n=1 Tax=unclassified Nocardioides TaxID=2615069 RepID=UPI00361B6587